MRRPEQWHSAPDYTTAMTTASNLIVTNHFTYVAVQVGADVIVFAGDSFNPINNAIDLVGRTLGDISVQNLI